MVKKNIFFPIIIASIVLSLLVITVPLVSKVQAIAPEVRDANQQPTDPTHQLALEGCRSSNPEQVIKGCMQLLKAKRILPDDLTDVQIAVGMAHAELGQADPAISMLSEVIKKRSKDADLYVTRAMLFAELGKMGEAKKDIDVALNLQTSHHSAHLIRAKIAYAQADYPNAITMATSMLKLWPDDVEALILRGQAYDILGLYELGLADFNVAARLEPDNPDIYFQRAISHLDNKYFDLAAMDLKKVLELDVGFPHAFELLQKAQAGIVGAAPQ